jgi:hypothetical protein
VSEEHSCSVDVSIDGGVHERSPTVCVADVRVIARSEALREFRRAPR